MKHTQWMLLSMVHQYIMHQSTNYVITWMRNEYVTIFCNKKLITQARNLYRIVAAVASFIIYSD